MAQPAPRYYPSWVMKRIGVTSMPLSPGVNVNPQSGKKTYGVRPKGPKFLGMTAGGFMRGVTGNARRGRR